MSVLSGIQSYLDAHRKLIPSNLVLDFSGSSIPPNTTFNDPVPEPPNSGAQNPLYHNIRDKILVQKKHLEELPPIGDKDMDHRRETLIDDATSHLELLEKLKVDAWSNHLLAQYLAQSSSNTGPIVVTVGKGAHISLSEASSR